MDINAGDKQGNTALHWSARKNNLDMMQYLIENGADVNSRNKLGTTPFLQVCSGGEISTMEFLLKHGADINSINDKEVTALWMAYHGVNRNSKIKLLLDHGIDKNIVKKSTLWNFLKDDEYLKNLLKEYMAKK